MTQKKFSSRDSLRIRAPPCTLSKGRGGWWENDNWNTTQQWRENTSDPPLSESNRRAVFTETVLRRDWRCLEDVAKIPGHRETLPVEGILLRRNTKEANIECTGDKMKHETYAADIITNTFKQGSKQDPYNPVRVEDIVRTTWTFYRQTHKARVLQITHVETIRPCYHVVVEQTIIGISAAFMLLWYGAASERYYQWSTEPIWKWHPCGKIWGARHRPHWNPSRQ